MCFYAEILKFIPQFFLLSLLIKSTYTELGRDRNSVESFLHPGMCQKFMAEFRSNLFSDQSDLGLHCSGNIVSIFLGISITVNL